MDLNVRIDKTLPVWSSDVVNFETGASKAQTLDPALYVYDHHGQEFTTRDRGALPAFYEDVILGRPLPTTFATPAIKDVDTLVAITLFLHRGIATHPGMPQLVYTVDFVHRLGLPALAHLDESLARFLSSLREYSTKEGLSERVTGERISNSVQWLIQYLQEGEFATLGATPDSAVRILDQGTGGFVVAEGRSLDGWVELYRMGFLRGILIQVDGERKRILAARKSALVPMDLVLAGRLLNQLEVATGAEHGGWSVSTDGLWLEHAEGTLLLLDQILAVLARV